MNRVSSLYIFNYRTLIANIDLFDKNSDKACFLGYKVSIFLAGRKITIFQNVWYKSGQVLKTALLRFRFPSMKTERQIQIFSTLKKIFFNKVFSKNPTYSCTNYL